MARATTLRRTSVAALGLGAIGLLGLGTASAARLGVDATSSDIAAGSAVVATCDRSVTTTLSDYQFQAGSGAWSASSVTVDDVADACAGSGVSVVVRDGSGAVLQRGSGTIGAAGATRTTVQLGTMTPTTVARIDVVIA